MTTAELIPILKSLHANPTNALPLSDWFEEQDEEEVANWMRTRMHRYRYGWDVVEAIAQLAGLSPLAFQINDALNAEVWERFSAECRWADVQESVDWNLRSNEPRLMGTVAEDWVRVSVPGRPSNFFIHVPVADIRQFRLPREGESPISGVLRCTYVGMHHLKTITTFSRIRRLDGRPVCLFAHSWLGSYRGVTYVSQLTVDHISHAERQLITTPPS